jgi:hypothetical protein
MKKNIESESSENELTFAERQDLAHRTRSALWVWLNWLSFDDLRSFYKDPINREHLFPHMENFYMNLPWGTMRHPDRYYNAEKAKIPRKESNWPTAEESGHSQYFLNHTPDDIFASIDRSIQKHDIDTEKIKELLQKKEYTELYYMVVDVFVDLLEEWYSQNDLRA